jgi:hypothetical protein
VIREEETGARKKVAAKKILERRLTNLTPSISEKENFEVNFRSSLYDITIERNRIRHMGLSGIGVVTFFNTEKIDLMICLTDLTIYRNSIIQCAQQIPANIPAKLLREAAYGGIVLASSDNCSIRGNRIENNGINEAEPICGIYIMMGDRLEIADNHILNNGPRLENANLAVRQGNRGGIVVKMSLKKYENFVTGNLDLSSFDGMPAIFIHGNIVTQPLGHALFLIAMGPVSITGNIFTSQGIDKKNIFSILAGSVFILNLGVSKDFFFSIVKSFRQLVQRKYKAYMEEGISGEAATILSRLQYLPSGNVMFSSNQTTLDLREPSVEISLSSQLIATLDDIAYNGNQSECASFMNLLENSTDTVILNTFLAGITVRSNDNRLQEGTTKAWFSLMSFGIANMAIGNQSTHCLLVFGIKRPDASILLGTNTVFLPLICERFYLQIDKKLAPEDNIDMVKAEIILPKKRKVE